MPRQEQQSWSQSLEHAVAFSSSISYLPRGASIEQQGTHAQSLMPAMSNLLWLSTRQELAQDPSTGQLLLTFIAGRHLTK